MKVKRKAKRKHASKHHIIPRSRGGSSNLENIAGLKIKEHQNYHTLFQNKTPDEIVEHLVNHYWNGQWEYVKRAYDNYGNSKD